MMAAQILLMLAVLTLNPVEKVWDTDHYSIYFEWYSDVLADIVVVEKGAYPFDHRLYLLNGELYRYPEYGFIKGWFYIGEARENHYLKFHPNYRVFEGRGGVSCSFGNCYDRVFEFYREGGVRKIEIYSENGTLIEQIYNGTVLIEKPPDRPIFLGVVIDDRWSVGFGLDGYDVVEVGIKDGVAEARVHEYPSKLVVYYAYVPSEYPQIASEVSDYYYGFVPQPQPILSPVTEATLQITLLIVVLISVSVVTIIVARKRSR